MPLTKHGSRAQTQASRRAGRPVGRRNVQELDAVAVAGEVRGEERVRDGRGLVGGGRVADGVVGDDVVALLEVLLPFALAVS